MEEENRIEAQVENIVVDAKDELDDVDIMGKEEEVESAKTTEAEMDDIVDDGGVAVVDNNDKELEEQTKSLIKEETLTEEEFVSEPMLSHSQNSNDNNTIQTSSSSNVAATTTITSTTRTSAPISTSVAPDLSTIVSEPFFMKNERSKEIFERWRNETAHLSIARTIASTIFLLQENIHSFTVRPIRSNKILVALESSFLNLVKTETQAFDVAKSTHQYDLAPELPYNGFRSLLKAFQQSLEKMHEALVECKGSKDSLFFNADGVHSTLDNYGVSMLSAWWVIFTSASRLHNEVLMGKRYFSKPSEGKISQDILRVSRFADVTPFYGSCAAFHLPDVIASTMRVILIAMCGFKSQFHNVKKQNFVMKNVTSALEAVKYAINPEDHSHQLVAQLRARSIPFVKAFWNLTDSTFARNMPKMTGPSLQINSVRYIKAQCLIHQGPYGPVTVIPDVVSDLLYKNLQQRTDEEKEAGEEEPLKSFYSTILFGYVQKLEACTTKEKLKQQSIVVKKEVDAFRKQHALTSVEYETLSRTLFYLHNSMSKYLKLKALQAQPGDITIIGNGSTTMKSSTQRNEFIREASPSIFSNATSPTTSFPNQSQSSTSSTSEFEEDTPNLAEAKVLGRLQRVRLGSTVDLSSSSVEEVGATRFGSIKTRLISYKRREGQVEGKQGGLPKSDWLIFHIHGGGFIANSSQSHEVYLRSWAKSFEYPIFSIDYALAPEHPYPRPVQECFFAYVWALNNAETLGWTGEKVLVTGDSAGGNLTVALTLRCIVEGIRLPTAIMPIYPALNINMEISPSRMLTMFDVLLCQGALETCLAAYSNQSVDSLDKVEHTEMLMCPVLAPDDFLKKLPFTTVVALAFDPLLDDSLEFVKRLRELNVAHNFQVLDDVPHGFLNFKDVARETVAAHKVVLKLLKNIFDSC
eukprot:m.71680 g.71680  ORF g.71680 m.71680 type:complete len:921 (+) comp8359_c0_seq1:131-2893(+)